MKRQRNQLWSSMLNYLSTIIILILFARITTTSATTNDRNTTIYYYPNWDSVPSVAVSRSNEHSSRFGNCVCKRFFNQCTPNCCCDSDCNSLSLLSFTQCNMEKSRILENFKCVADNVLMYKNLPKNIKANSWENLGTPTPLFCVYYDSSPIQGTFYEELPDFTDSDISNAISQDLKREYRRTNHFDEGYNDNPADDTNLMYTYGSSIYVALKTNTTKPDSLLRIPQKLFSEMCDDGVSVSFDQNMTPDVCYRYITDLEKTCNTLSASLLTTKMLIYTNPKRASFVGVNIRSVHEKTGNGSLVTLNSLPEVLYSDNICSFALSSLQYYITSSYNGTILFVDADVVLTNITSDVTLYPMDYGVTFLIENSVESIVSGQVRPNSGNPGYLLGSPVIAGIQITNEVNTNSEQTMKNAVAQNKNGIELPIGLSCSDQTTVVGFGEDLVTACRIELTLAELESFCLSNDIDVLGQVESSFNLVGRFGSANYLHRIDWVPISTAEVPKSTWNAASQVCNNLAAGLQYEFITAKASSKYNEQWRIGGVRRSRYGITWKFTNSDPTTKQAFWIQFRAKFVSLASQDTIVKVSKVPNLLPTLPEDVFYPFSLFSTSTRKSYTPILTLTLSLMSLSLCLI